MSNNLFERSEEFRLVDVNGVILDNPNDFIIIREPDGFSEIDITLQRDRQAHGFSFEFSDPNKKYGFDRVPFEGETLSGYELLDQLFESKGTNAVCYFEYYTINFSVYTRQIRAKIEFDTRSRKYEKLEFSTSRVNLASIINNRFDTKVDFLNSESLDGTTITGITPVDVYTHSQRFRIEGELNNFGDENQLAQGRTGIYYYPEQFGDTERFRSQFIINNPFPRITNELELFGYQGEVIYGGGLPTDIDGFFLFNAPDDGTYDIDWRSPVSDIESTFATRFNSGGTTGSTGEIRFFYKINEGGTPVEFDTVSGINITGPSPENNSYRYPLDQIVFQEKIELKRGDNFYIYYEYFHDETDVGGNQRNRQLLTRVKFRGNESIFDPGILIGFVNIVAFTTAETTKTPSYYYWESINHVLESITSQTNILDSTFFDREDRGALADGGGGQNVLTNGFLLRQFANDKGVRASFADMVEHIQSVFGQGYQVGEEKVLIQRISEFYQDKEIISLENVYDITDEFDSEYSWNKINIGYSDYTEGDEFERVNTLDEFHTEHEYLLPLRSIDNSLDLFSPIIMSGYLIEITRRESFAETVTESWKYDDNLFGVAVRRYDTITIGSGQDIEGLTSIDSLIGDDLFSLPGNWKFIENETTLEISGNALAGSYTINNVEVIISETTDEQITLVRVAESLSTTITTAGQIDLSQTYINSEKNEPFDSITGIISPNTIYNGRHNIKNMLYNYAPLINSGLNYNDGTDLVRNTDYVNNGDAALQFKVGQGFNTLDPNRLNVSQKSNLQVNQINQFNRLFLPIIVTLKCPLSFDDLLYIKQALLNENADDVNFGYLSYVDDFGVNRKLFITELKYTPKDNIATIVGILKYDAP